MQNLLPSQFRSGMVLLLDGVPHAVEEFHTAGSAQTKHKLHVRLRNLQTGRIAERAFAEADRVSAADSHQRAVTYSYRQADRFVFLDGQTFEEFVLTGEQVGERHWFLVENKEYRALFVEGKLLDLALPEHVAMKVVETAQPQHGPSHGTAYKDATLEGGLRIMVPLFIRPGESVSVDTRTRKYFGKDAGG